jgi:hypothetical protein
MNTKPIPSAQAQAQDVVPPNPAPLVVTYTNWRGETDTRQILPAKIWFGATEWHKEPQWLLRGVDIAKGAARDFALADFGLKGWRDIASAPVGDVSACIDIWCAEHDCRRTYCFWDAETDRWVYEDFDGGEYRVRGISRPVAWMPTPAKPEGV